MVTIGMNYSVLAGKEEIFVNAFRGVIELMKTIGGHTQTKLFRDLDRPNDFLIVSDWNSEQEFNDFIKSDTFKKVANWGKEQILAGRPTHTVYKI
ncbi:antibiotic biosynthesis monooxygenase [bacterium]|nr:antibiotic biosynthesis monooxygenase [bacterium]